MNERPLSLYMVEVEIQKLGLLAWNLVLFSQLHAASGEKKICFQKLTQANVNGK